MKDYKMKNKTCGECERFNKDLFFCKLDKECRSRFPAQDACDMFEPIHKITIGDKIRQMSDEELAKFLRQINRCPPGECRSDKCELCWLQYIREEAKDERY